MKFEWYQILVAWFAVGVFFLWVLLALGGILNLIARISSPERSADVQVQAMFTENINVNQDPTIPVGVFNPKHEARRELRGR